MRRALPAHALFFPAAALYAGAFVPASIAGMTGIVPMPAALASASAHAHEMLIGYALAVVAGYQLPPLSAPRVLTLFGLWIVGRLAFFAAPGGGMTAGANAAFAIAVGLYAVPRLLRSAKKLRNQALPALLLAVCVAALAYEGMRWTAAPASSALLPMILLLSALMLFMGGRILAPMAAGAFYRQGSSLGPRVQPRVEAALLVTTAVAAVGAATPNLDIVARIGCVSAGALALTRLLRWRLWRCASGDVLRFAAGYAWLGVGLIAIGSASPDGIRLAAIHLVTVGALGTLSFNVMARVGLGRAGRDDRQGFALTAGTLLVSVAAVARFVSALLLQHWQGLLLLAASCWSAAFLTLFAVLLQAAAMRARREE